MAQETKPLEEQQMRRLHERHLWRPVHGKRQRETESRLLPSGQQRDPLWLAQPPSSPDNHPETPDLVRENFFIHNVCHGVLVLEIDGLAHFTAEKSLNLAVIHEPMLCLRIMLNGEDRMLLPSQAEAWHLQAGHLGLVHEPEIATQIILHPGRMRHLNVLITRDGLRTLLDDMPLPAMLEAFMEGGDAPLLWQHTLTDALQRISLEIVHAGKQDPYYRLFLRCKVMELLVEWLQLLARDRLPATGTHDGKERRLLEEACQRLTHSPHSVPSLEELSRHLGVTPRKLNDLFRQHHGTTLFEWFAEWKMKQAFTQLQNSNRPIKEIAFDLGYLHVNNFTLAFTRYFGIPPARLRKGVST
ncbi:MAG: helix-turn-helix transcriptional regulator [Magnetococcales bacterium]|nr:helix-turn-helix transcriptional regulator [Magnetococcales bacterium]